MNFLDLRTKAVCRRPIYWPILSINILISISTGYKCCEFYWRYISIFALRDQILVAKKEMMTSISGLKIFINCAGLDFELNSEASNDHLSSTWYKGLHKLMRRRSAVYSRNHSTSSQRRNSVDSQISISIRRYYFGLSYLKPSTYLILPAYCLETLYFPSYFSELFL